jgi:hypothetical protein
MAVHILCSLQCNGFVFVARMLLLMEEMRQEIRTLRDEVQCQRVLVQTLHPANRDEPLNLPNGLSLPLRTPVQVDSLTTVLADADVKAKLVLIQFALNIKYIYYVLQLNLASLVCAVAQYCKFIIATQSAIIVY